MHELRFFSPQQVDQILRDGIKAGRSGSHSAIERILRHEPGVQRIELWRRIRHLKFPRASRRVRSDWSAEDDDILRQGYSAGWQAKRAAISALLKRHAGWRPNVIWRRAAKLALIETHFSKGQERHHHSWSEEDDRKLLDMAGYKRARLIAKTLHRSEAAVRYRLTMLGESSRVHHEGFARSELARELHVSCATIQKWIATRLLEVRDPRITRNSLERLRRSHPASTTNTAESVLEPQRTLVPSSDASSFAHEGHTCCSSKCSSPLRQPSRAMYLWEKTAEFLGTSLAAVENLIANGVLQLWDPWITENSLREFCQLHGSLIDSTFLSQETRLWLRQSMDWVPAADMETSLHLACHRKHARRMHQCLTCGRTVRGNAFFRHLKRCGRIPQAPGSSARDRAEGMNENRSAHFSPRPNQMPAGESRRIGQ